MAQDVTVVHREDDKKDAEGIDATDILCLGDPNPVPHVTNIHA